MAGRLEGKVVIVTGGATGIGEAASWLFASEGAAVIVADTKAKEEKAKTMVGEIKFQGGTATFVRADIAKPGEIEAMVLKTVASYGQLDCAFNAATVSGAAPIIETTIEQWDGIMNTNLKGIWLCMKYEIQAMMKNKKGGVIVNLASVGGLMGFALTGAFAASKGGVIALTRTAAIECAQHNIRVNSISPDAVASDIFAMLPDEQKIQIARLYPLQRASSPEEIAKAVMYLCSDDAASITGHNLVMDGGYSGH
jgi:NAD(P)-dependent dehydrogenase (short-subunit alcohol dehydrogenase family)